MFDNQGEFRIEAIIYARPDTLAVLRILGDYPKTANLKVGQGDGSKGRGGLQPHDVLLILGFWKAEGLFFLAALSESLSWLKAKMETMPSRTLIPAC